MMRKQQDKYLRGLQAEKTIAQILSKLPKQEYKVFHNIKARYGNIDHIVIRNDGAVYLLETKSHSGNVTWDGHELLRDDKPFEKNFISQVTLNVIWLREYIKKHTGISTWIVGILVFPNALIYSANRKRVLHLQPVKRVNVITAGYMTRLIELYRPKNKRKKIWDRFENINCRDMKALTKRYSSFY